MNMCTALENLKNEGKKEGKKEGKIEILTQLVNDGLISISDAAEKLNVSVGQFESLMR
ncbi:MAG: resolvase [Clostridiales bacterium]|nr:resolvase [Clostridiales bacterium]